MSTMAVFTLEDLHLFHTIDREIFGRLVINLARDPAESLLVMALWLFLEDMSFPCITFKMLSLPDGMVNGLAVEAVACLRCLESKTPPVLCDGDIPLTAVTLGSSISLKMLYLNRFKIISGIKAFLKNVCAHVFTDILVQIFPSQAILNCPLIIPGFPHPTFGSISIIPRSLDYVFPSKGMWGWSLNIEAPVDDRTMFLTFSRGYPVTEAEVRALFTAYYGDCVENVHMEPSASTSTDQSLYAQMVVRDISTIDKILSRGPIAKYRINGKHVWARKFERREQA